jgi:hypothetical protein
LPCHENRHKYSFFFLPVINNIEPQRCDLGMKSHWRREIFHRSRISATCGVYNEESDLDFTGKPCCCEFCGQRDSLGQICEVSQQVCSTVTDCIQRRHGTCVDAGDQPAVEPFHVQWILGVCAVTMAPFFVPAIALFAAGDVVLGLAG